MKVSDFSCEKKVNAADHLVPDKVVTDEDETEEDEKDEEELPKAKRRRRKAKQRKPFPKRGMKYAFRLVGPDKLLVKACPFRSAKQGIGRTT